jgi:hypothetical protein
MRPLTDETVPGRKTSKAQRKGVRIVKAHGPFVVLSLVIVAACSVAGAPSAAAEATSDSIATPSTATVPSSTPAATPIVSLVPCPSGGTPESPITLTAEEALSCDLRAMAEGSGTTIEEEYARYQMSLALDGITGPLAEARPDIFIGAALPEEPGGVPKLSIKGPADDFVRELVARAAIAVEIADNQPYSMDEVNDRQTRISTALQAAGFKNFAIGFDIRSARFRAAVTIEEGLPSTAEEVLALLPSELSADLDLEMSATPVAVDTIPE